MLDNDRRCAIVLSVVALLAALVCAPAAFATEVKVYAFRCGYLKTTKEKIVAGRGVGQPYTIPIPFFVIKHGSSWVALDTGNNRQVAVDPVAYWGKPITDAYYPVMRPEDAFPNQVKTRLGIEPKDFNAVIISHGHLDHAGSIDAFADTEVPIYIQKAEYDAIKKAAASDKKTAYIPADFKQLPHLNIVVVDGLVDLFHDGTVVAFPVPGHTAGTQGVLVKTSAGRTLILASDADYTLENLYEAIPPGLAWNVPQATEGLYMFQLMGYLGAQTIPMHDPFFWKNKPLAPDVFEW
jgi:glyoxylase-like metal-dependent hydrolase (beta-lactamase superfamily II)